MFLLHNKKPLVCSGNILDVHLYVCTIIFVHFPNTKSSIAIFTYVCKYIYMFSVPS